MCKIFSTLEARCNKIIHLVRIGVIRSPGPWIHHRLRVLLHRPVLQRWWYATRAGATSTTAATSTTGVVYLRRTSTAAVQLLCCTYEVHLQQYVVLITVCVAQLCKSSMGRDQGDRLGLRSKQRQPTLVLSAVLEKRQRPTVRAGSYCALLCRTTRCT